MADRIFRYSDPSPTAWAEFIAVMHSGRQFECDEEMYYYWLEVLPPVWMCRTIKWDDDQTVTNTMGFAEGAELVTAFWKRGDRFFGRQTKIMNPYA